MPKIRQSSLRNIHQYRDSAVFCSLYVLHLRKMRPTQTMAGSARFCYTWVIRLHFSLTTSGAPDYDLFKYALIHCESGACTSPHRVLVLRDGDSPEEYVCVGLCWEGTTLADIRAPG